MKDKDGLLLEKIYTSMKHPGVYVDRNETPIKKGDIIKYDEGPSNGQSIDEIIEIDGELYLKMKIGEPKWSYVDDKPIPLKYATLMPNNSQFNVCSDMEIIGNVDENPELLTPEAAEKIFGKD